MKITIEADVLKRLAQLRDDLNDGATWRRGARIGAMLDEVISPVLDLVEPIPFALSSGVVLVDAQGVVDQAAYEAWLATQED